MENRLAITPLQLLKAKGNLNQKGKVEDGGNPNIRNTRRKVYVEEIHKGEDQNKQRVRKSRIKIQRNTERRKRQLKGLDSGAELVDIAIDLNQDMNIGCGVLPRKATGEP